MELPFFKHSKLAALCL